MHYKNPNIEINKFNFANFLYSMILLQPVMLLFYQLNGLTIKEFFFFQGIFYLASIIFETPVGYLSDSISRKKLIILSFSILAGINVLWFLCKGYYVVLIGEILFALSKVILDNAISGYLCDYLNNNNLKNKMVKYYGKLNFFLSAGTAFAAICGTWLYQTYGVKFILTSEFIALIAAILLITTLPDFKQCPVQNFSKRLTEFSVTIKKLYCNPNIRYYIFYSGLLASFSILFAVSFQPLMLGSLCPIALFGVIHFVNHGIRAFSGIIASKIKFNIRKLIVPLFVLYLLAFGCIFIILHTQNIFIVASLLFLICLIIGVQLVFTIMHVSRLHKFVSTSERGSLMSVNNAVKRILCAAFLISSRIFIDKADLNLFFTVALVIFLIVCSYVMMKSYKVEKLV